MKQQFLTSALKIRVGADECEYNLLKINIATSIYYLNLKKRNYNYLKKIHKFYIPFDLHKWCSTFTINKKKTVR